MKPTVIALVCLSLLLVHVNLSMAGRKGGLGRGLKDLFKKPFKPKTKLDTKKNKQPTHFNHGSYPQQPGRPGGYPNQGSYPQQPGRPGGYPNQGSYPQQPGRPGGYPNQGSYPQHPGYPAGGYPAGGYPAGGYPAQGYPYGGGYGSYGGYPGGFINQNPNNRILSPHYGGSYGYGGYGGGGGSPFSHSVGAMGFVPSDKSRGFGRSAAMAAAGGAVAGMALGYGLGRFPRPHFHFHSPEQEYYYNHYMYRKYGAKSTDTNDYSRDYRYTQLPDDFNTYMESCLKRTDLLPDKSQTPNNKPAVTTMKTTTAASVNTTTTSAPATGIGNNVTSSSAAAGNSSTTAPSTAHPLNESEVNAVPPASQALRSAPAAAAAPAPAPAPAAPAPAPAAPPAAADDDDTVSIVEIGYPALIRQMKVKRCTELYIVYSEKHLKKNTKPRTSSGAQGLETGLWGLLSVVTSAILMLLNSNIQTLLH